MKKSSVKDLKAAPYNPRTITEEKLAALGKSMKEFGDLSGVNYSRRPYE
jgi:ParB-like chromosome segregation protein Spo0J